MHLLKCCPKLESWDSRPTGFVSSYKAETAPIIRSSWVRVIICETVHLGRAAAPQLGGSIKVGNGGSKKMAKPALPTPQIFYTW